MPRYSPPATMTRFLCLLLFFALDAVAASADTHATRVKGRYQEANTVKFDLVDGIAYASKSGADTMLYVTAKPIASQALADSICGLPRARSLALLRNAGALVVRFDDDGRSTYFEAGTPYGASSIEM